MRIRMAPTLVLFFSEATLWDLAAALDEVAERFQIASFDSVDWFFPDSGHWRVLARFDEKVLESYTENQRELVRAEVGAAPSAVLSLTLNHRMMDDACDAAKTLVVHLLGKFYGIVDDRCGEDSIWNIEQIRKTKRGVEFLGCYR
jgi:hypothetical protein